MLTIHNAMHPQAEVDRLWLSEVQACVPWTKAIVTRVRTGPGPDKHDETMFLNHYTIILL